MPLQNPIPHDVIVRELDEYYEGLEDARTYLRQQLRLGAAGPLRLFYLISLAAIATADDVEFFEKVKRHGTAFEQYVANNLLHVVALERPDTVAGFREIR